MINGQAAFACTILGFHVVASVFLTLSEHVWIKCCILNTSQMYDYREAYQDLQISYSCN